MQPLRTWRHRCWPDMYALYMLALCVCRICWRRVARRCWPYMYALYVGLICTPYMLAMKRAQILALYVCLYMLALYAGVEQQVLALSGQRKLMVVCLMCMPYMYALCVCLISGVGTLKAEKTDIFIEKSDGCMPYMYALHVCHMCMPYVYAFYVCLMCM